LPFFATRPTIAPLPETSAYHVSHHEPKGVANKYACVWRGAATLYWIEQAWGASGSADFQWEGGAAEEGGGTLVEDDFGFAHGIMRDAGEGSNVLPRFSALQSFR
jgi:hypothetical protein